MTKSIQRAIKDQVPVSKPCPHSKRWWNSELRELKKKLNRLSRETIRYRVVPHHPCHTECRERANAYGQAILLAKNLEEASDNDLWNINCYLKAPVGDGGKSYIPTLKAKEEDRFIQEVKDNEGKVEAFHKIFFPPKPAESSVPAEFNYPEPLPPPDTITKEQIIRHIKALSPYKASGPDQIPNIVLQETAEIIVVYLDHVFRAII